MPPAAVDRARLARHLHAGIVGVQNEFARPRESSRIIGEQQRRAETDANGFRSGVFHSARDASGRFRRRLLGDVGSERERSSVPHRHRSGIPGCRRRLVRSFRSRFRSGTHRRDAPGRSDDGDATESFEEGTTPDAHGHTSVRIDKCFRVIGVETPPVLTPVTATAETKSVRGSVVTVSRYSPPPCRRNTGGLTTDPISPWRRDRPPRRPCRLHRPRQRRHAPSADRPRRPRRALPSA